MGCDIHMVLERKIKGEWVGMHSFPYLRGAVHEPKTDKDAYYYPGWIATDRNYSLFAAVAQVRSYGDEGMEPRGVLPDLSPLARFEVDGWGEDVHSHTWLTLHEATPLFLAHYGQDDLLTDRRHYTCANLLGADYNEDKDLLDYRLIIWFDN